MRIRRRRSREGLRLKLVGAFLNLDAAINRQVLESLTEAIRPANGGADRAFKVAHPKEKLLGVLGQKSGTGLEISGLTMSSRLDRHRGSDCIAITFLSTQAKF